MAFQNSSKNDQARLRRPLLKQFGNFGEDAEMTDEEYATFIREKIAEIESKIFRIKDKTSPARRELVQVKQALALEAWNIKGRKISARPGAIAESFMNVARRYLPAQVFDDIMTVSRVELDERLRAIQNPSAHQPKL